MKKIKITKNGKYVLPKKHVKDIKIPQQKRKIKGKKKPEADTKILLTKRGRNR